MLHTLPEYRRHCERRASVSDVTVVVTVRAHHGNPWVTERLALLGASYEPRPDVVVLDLGSVGEHREGLERTAEAQGLRYRHVADDGTYSAARAHNLGFREVRTELVFFTDVDCVGPRDLFARLVEAANDLGMLGRADQMLNLPVYHLAPKTTETVLSETDAEARSRVLRRLAVDGAFADFGTSVEYVAPYSNIFLCHRDFFSLTGGYDERFRGHGSEDFEYLLRFAKIAGGLPMPEELTADVYGPLKADFFRAKTFRGFRRQLELLALPAELAGLRTFHLAHPKPARDESGWYERHDWRRERFTPAVDRWASDPRGLLECDWLPREKTALALVAPDDDVGPFLALRLAGYGVVRAETAGETGARADAVVISGQSHRGRSELREAFDDAVRAGVRGMIIASGPLPDAVNYEIGARAGSAPSDGFTGEQLAIARAYRRALAAGEAQRPDQEEPAATRARLASPAPGEGRRCLVAPSARDALSAQIARETGVQVVLIGGSATGDHVLALPSDANLHAVLDAVDVVVCADRATIVAALAHGKPTIALGGDVTIAELPLALRAETAEDALRLAGSAHAPDADEARLDRVFASLLFHECSFFAGGHVYRLRLDDADVRWTLASVDRPLGEKSYVAARLGVNIRPRPPKPPPRSERDLPLPRKVRKLVRDPGGFFADSKSELLQSFGEKYFPPDDD